jgi:hypothetical protein
MAEKRSRRRFTPAFKAQAVERQLNGRHSFCQREAHQPYHHSAAAGLWLVPEPRRTAPGAAAHRAPDARDGTVRSPEPPAGSITAITASNILPPTTEPF